MPSLTEATNSICECFNTAWNNRTPIEWANVVNLGGTKLSEGNDAYAAFHVIHEGSDQLSLGEAGNRVFTREGQFIAQIFVPVAKRGLEESDLLAKAAIDAFEGITFGGVRFHQVGAKTVGPSGNWFQVNVSGNFEFDEVK